MLPLEYFDRFREALSELPILPPGRKYTKSELVCDRFHLFSDRGLDVYYAPFHHEQRNARVALVGLTPGFTQMEEAFRAAKTGERDGLNGVALFAHIDATGSFSGALRSNLIRMLDGIKLNERLGVASCRDLFAGATGMAHFTSAVSAPIFKAGENYNGSLIRVSALRRWILQNLAAELAALPPSAIIIPLGKGAAEAVDLIAAEDLIDASRCLAGFPHPSGANGHGRRLFEAGKSRWREQIEAA